MNNKSKTFFIIFLFLFTLSFCIFQGEKSSLAIEKNLLITTQKSNIHNTILANNIYLNQMENTNSNIGQKYYESDRIVQLLKIIMSFIVPALILFTGFSSKLGHFSQKIGRNLFLTAGIYGILYTLIDNLLNLPLTFYGSYVQSHIFGISHQPFVSWIKSYSLELLLTSCGLLFLLWIPYKLIKNHPKRWWIYTGILIIPVTLFIYLAQPVIIDPLFNDFKPLDDKTVERSLIELTKKANIENCKILQIDKSKDTNMINAYMTGIGSSKRIVLWDTAIKSLNLRELRFIMAHEIGHYVLGHIKKLVVVDIIITFIVLYIISKLAPPLINKYSKKLRFKELYNVASYPIAIIIINFCFLFITPSMNAYSCYMERQADNFALEITQDKEAGISAFDKLARNGFVIPSPDPLYKLWKYDHPPINERVEHFKKYKQHKE
ncbi:M48 family metallopeptidase [Clostridium brassicae]|uniref:M48 family metallopeptidase n=1 Tax=Clostridium brassicae TaxID=2999072 RepID=A0ABT4DGY3_9CLOT|nr:M48 family metallopeptidase [Clostridium brassicae]MCY6960361.1 M48 family metallopeptidase [Clostridium brassicae]